MEERKHDNNCDGMIFIQQVIDRSVVHYLDQFACNFVEEFVHIFTLTSRSFDEVHIVNPSELFTHVVR